MFIQKPSDRSENDFLLVSGLFMTMLVVSNMMGTKLFVVSWLAWLTGGDVTLTTGIITYPFTFLFTDIVSEIWGKRKADRMVVYGFFASLIMLFVLSIAIQTPPSPVWNVDRAHAPFFSPDYQFFNENGELRGASSVAAQAAFSFTFSAPGLLLFASMLAYLTAQLADNFLFHFWRKVTAGRHLWIRNNGSTIISQLIDTLIVNSIFLYFYWEMPFFVATPEKPVTIFEVIVSVYVFKVIIALMDTPFVYLGVGLLKYRIQTDPERPELDAADLR